MSISTANIRQLIPALRKSRYAKFDGAVFAIHPEQNICNIALPLTAGNPTKILNIYDAGKIAPSLFLKIKPHPGAYAGDIYFENCPYKFHEAAQIRELAEEHGLTQTVQDAIFYMETIFNFIIDESKKSDNEFRSGIIASNEEDLLTHSEDALSLLLYTDSYEHISAHQIIAGMLNMIFYNHINGFEIYLDEYDSDDDFHEGEIQPADLHMLLLASFAGFATIISLITIIGTLIS